MQNQKNNVFLNPKFKKLYAITSCGLFLLIALVLLIMMLCGNNVAKDNSEIFTYCTALLFILSGLGMFIDESIRKIPGMIIIVCTAIYSFSYIVVCFLKGDPSIFGYVLLGVYSCFIGISYIIYKNVYPIVLVKEKGVKLFNTVYLLILLTVTIVAGFMYAI